MRVDQHTSRFAALLASAASTDPVAGSTHGYYRYPARFSPQFARCAIEGLTDPGDTVLDPFMGGGTSAVEAVAAGRRFIGCDINPLSHFIAHVKTTPVSPQGLAEVIEWTRVLDRENDLRSRSIPDYDWEPYQLNLPWWLRNTIELALRRVLILSSEKTRRFARCALLKTGQWALDCRRTVPTAREFIARLQEDAVEMAGGMREYRSRIGRSSLKPRQVESNRRLILGSSAEVLANAALPRGWKAPRLILTSPPYAVSAANYSRLTAKDSRKGRYSKT